ncbi:condensation domain-containing protein [Streptomyces sp. NPDC059467]|uniref:condensation domain-containing protein n=1 Tax=Streptomyces sp. NPDC059467 TaxID=3346844 RepID=UPI0036AA4AE8
MNADTTGRPAAEAVGLPPDRPAPVVPQYFRGHCATPWAGRSAEELTTVTQAVLRRATGRARVAVGVLRAGDTGAELIEVSGDLAAGGPHAAVPPPLVIADLTAAGTPRATAPGDHAMVLRLEPGTLTADYDCDRHTAEGVRSFLADLVTVRNILVRCPGTPDAELPVARRSEAVRAAAAPSPERQPPQGPVERTVARLWAELLDLADHRSIDRDESFFSLGGGSLTAIRAANRLRERFGIGHAKELLSRAVTVRTVAEVIEQALAARGDSTGGGHPVPRPAGTAPAVSSAQEQIWLFEQWWPGTAAYNMPWALRIQGPLDETLLRGALEEVLRRHEVLRTTFTDDRGAPRAVVHEVPRLPWIRHDLSATAEDEREDAAGRLLARSAAEPFDLAGGPLVRADLLRLSASRHVLLLNVHHLVHDGWSFEVLLRELAEGYDAVVSGRPPALPGLRVQYGDLAAADRAALTDDVLDESLCFWRTELDGAPALLDLPADRPRPVSPSHRGDSVPFGLPDELCARLREFAGQRGTTLYPVLLTAFQVLLHHDSGLPDLVVGTNVALRDRLEAERLIGPLFTMLPVRSDAAGNPDFEELLDRTRTRLLAAFGHKDIPFDVLVGRLAPERRSDRSPVYQTAFEFAEQARVAAPTDLAWSHDLVDTGAAKLDLILTVTERGTAVGGLCTYATDLFDRARIEHLTAAYLQILTAVLDQPDVPVSALATRTLGPVPAGRAVTGPSVTGLSVDGPETPDAGGPVTDVLAGLWAEVLDRPRESIGPQSDFFALGGRSLDALRLNSRLRETLRVRVSVADLFRAPTLSALASVVTAQAKDPGLVLRLARAVLRMWEMSPQERRALMARTTRSSDREADHNGKQAPDEERNGK